MKIALLGLGAIGSWFAHELAKYNEVYVYDINPQIVSRFEACKPINKLEDLKTIRPEMVLNAVSLNQTISVFRSIIQYLEPNCTLVDVASVKVGLQEFYSTVQQPFVSIHPMFGPTFADLHHLIEENAVIITESDDNGVRFFRDFFQRFHLNLYEYSFVEHDQVIAYSLSIPFISTMVFAGCMNNQAVPGTTFKKHLAIAKGLLSETDELLCEILFNPNTITQVEKINARLSYLIHIIKDRDFEEMQKFLKGLRSNILQPPK